MPKLNCEECGTRMIIPDGHAYFRIGTVDGNASGLLCWKCCKKQNYKSDACKSCIDKSLCDGSFKKAFLDMLKKNKGVI